MKTKTYIFSLLLFILSVKTSFSPSENTWTKKEIIKHYRIHELKRSEFTPERLEEYLKLRGIDNYKIVFRQAILETGWFKSKSFVDYCNLFGMKFPNERETLAKDVALSHSSYKHWTDSVDDLKLWQKFWKEKGKSFNNYYDFLGKLPYAEDKYYINKLKALSI